MNSFFQKYQVEGNVPEQDEIEQSRMAAVQGLVEQGITNPEEIMNYLNYDEEGNEVGDFTMEEVQQYLEAASNQELPEFQSPYEEEEVVEGEEESPQEETTEEEEEEMKMGGAFMQMAKKMYGGNAPGGSHANFPQKKKGGSFKPLMKKGGNTYGQGTDTYLNEMKNSFMTGMNELVTNAKMQNQLKAMGLPNNALKMGGSSKPKYQYYGNVNKGIRAQYPAPGYTWEQWETLSDNEKQQIGNRLQQEYYRYNYPYGYGYPPYPYNPQLGWEGLGMNMDQRGATPADIFAAFPGLGESFAQGKNKRIGFDRRGLFGLGPVRSGYVEWDGGYTPSASTPSSGQSTYYDFSGKGRPRSGGMFPNYGAEIKKGFQNLGQELANRLNLKGYQKTTPKQQEPEIGDVRNINTRPIMTALGRTFDPLRADLGARRLTVKQQSKKHGGAHFTKFQTMGSNQPVAYDPSQDEAYAEPSIYQGYDSSMPNNNLPVNTGPDYLGIGEASGNLADEARQTIDPEGPLGEEKEPFPQKNKNRAYWEYSDPEGDVRRTLGRMASWTQRLNAQDAARKAQYNTKTISAHNAGFGSIPADGFKRKGVYTPNVLTQNQFPINQTPVERQDMTLRTPSRLGSRFEGFNLFAQTGGQSFSNMDDYESDYQVGSEHYLTDDEIARIEEMGGQVQILQ
jgi:hypothetical protein